VLAALDATDIFRHELAKPQQVFTRFDPLLIDIRDENPPPLACAERVQTFRSKFAVERLNEGVD
jgi:hypothetical protein